MKTFRNTPTGENLINSLEANSITLEEFKNQFLAFVSDGEISPEILLSLLNICQEMKEDVFEEYRQNEIIQKISDEKHDWLPGYFDKHIVFAEKNFSLKRIEHLISVKNYFIGQGYDGFTSDPSISPLNVTENCKNNDDTMNYFKSISTNGYTPTNNLKKSVESGDLAFIRSALFMQLNNKRLTNDEVKKSIAWAFNRTPSLFEKYIENGYSQPIISDKQKWNADYYSMQEVYAGSNFSEKRLVHMLAVRVHIMPTQASNTPLAQKRPTSRGANAYSNSSGRSYSQQHSTSSQSYKQPTPSQPESDWPPYIKAAIAVGGAIAALAILIISKIR